MATGVDSIVAPKLTGLSVSKARPSKSSTCNRRETFRLRTFGVEKRLLSCANIRSPLKGKAGTRFGADWPDQPATNAGLTISSSSPSQASSRSQGGSSSHRRPILSVKEGYSIASVDRGRQVIPRVPSAAPARGKGVERANPSPLAVMGPEDNSARTHTTHHSESIAGTAG